MQYGISLPNFGPFFDVSLLADLAHDAEIAGWDGFFLWDHVYWDVFPLSDPWIALTAIALRTQRVRIGTMVTPLPRRRPVKLARETVTLDHLSGGRLILGVGLGVRPQEWEQLGDEGDLPTRGAMLDEHLDVLGQLWRGEGPAHHGEHYTVDVHGLPNQHDPIPFAPAALQTPRIPVWVAGRWPNKRPFRRGAQWDGIVPTSVAGGNHERLPPDQVRDCIAYTMEHRASAEPFSVAIGGHSPEGDAQAARRHVATYAAAGATWWPEDLSPFAFDWHREGPWPLARMFEHIRQGPPR